MDDPLRPKTVPLSAETILWFEFLLDPSLLTVHLTKEDTRKLVRLRSLFNFFFKFYQFSADTNRIDFTIFVYCTGKSIES